MGSIGLLQETLAPKYKVVAAMWRIDELTDELLERAAVLASGTNADGVVLKPLLLDDIVSKTAYERPLRANCLEFGRARTVLREADGLVVTSPCTLELRDFYDLRELNVVSAGSGVFDFTATYRWAAFWPDGAGYREAGDASVRFHVDRLGGASYVRLEGK